MRKLNFLKWFLLALNLFAVIGLSGNLYTFYKHDFSSELFYRMKSNFTEFKFWLLFSNDLLFYLGLVMLLFAIHSIIKTKKFTKKVNSLFNYSALILLVSAIYSTILYLIDYNYYDKNFMIQSLSFNFLQIILSIMLFAISDVIKLGQITQEENELTI